MGESARGKAPARLRSVSSLASALLRGLTLASRFFLIVVIAKFLTPQELGLFGIMSAAIAFVLLGLGMEFYAYSMRELMGQTETRRVCIMRDQILLYVCGYAAILPLVGLIFLAGWLPKQLIPWIFFLSITEHVSHEASRALVALSRPFASNLVLFVRTGAWVYVLFAYAFLDERARNLEAVFGAWLIGALASIVVVAFIMRRMPWRIIWRTPVDWKWIGTGLGTARPFMVTAVSALGLSYMDRFILNAYWGPSLVGTLTFYTGITSAIHSMLNAGVSTTFMPRLVNVWREGNRQDYSSEMKRYLRHTLLLVLPLALVALLAINPIVDWIGRSEYSESLLAYYLFLVAGVIRCVADVPIYGLYSQHRDGALLKVNLAAFVVSLLVNLLLVPVLGLYGCAIAAIAGVIVLVFSAWIALPRQHVTRQE